MRLRRDYTGFELARLVGRLGDDYPVVPPSWLGVTWYVLPLLAVVAWLALFVRGPARVRVLHAVLGVTMIAMTFAYGVAAAHYGRLVVGEVVAFAGAFLICAGALVQPSLLSPISCADEGDHD